MSKEDTNKFIKALISLAIITIIVSVSCYFFFNRNNEDIDKSKCNLIDIQTLHNDYTDNEIYAEDKYSGNYYYFTEEVYKVTEYLGDYYITFRFNSDRDNTKTIEINAYFKDKNALKNITKGDLLTIYGKFKQRSIKNYANISAYSFEHCKLEKH